MDIRIILAYGLAIILWGSAFPGIRVALESYNPYHLALLRMVTAALILLIFAVAVKMKLPDKKDIPIILLLGFLGFSIYHTFLSIGEKTVNAGAASLLIMTVPLMSALLATIFLREKFGVFGWIGSLVAFVGVALISIETGGQFSIEWGAVIILLGALGESCYFVFQSSYLRKYGFLPFTVYTIFAGTLFMLPFSGGLWSAVTQASMESTLTVIYLGIFPTVIPYFAVAYATARQGASEATSFLYLVPAAAIFISWIWLDEVPALLSIAGGALALVGVSLTKLRTAPGRENSLSN
ncbi:DMT family transporter [Planococcus lenghuensis]|uniref:EamA family transporter n=1 Tax=Planococcus lenghuensis TaxID=2213202 RepID=A0A1Q2KWV8_9BACL|nr:DMT family transporter [Planococcus lenghuensis]AQQ52633.1 EamA family transporter [Planococcus lenghuensis]